MAMQGVLIRLWVRRGRSEVDDAFGGGWWLRREIGIVVNLLKSGSGARQRRFMWRSPCVEERLAM